MGEWPKNIFPQSPQKIEAEARRSITETSIQEDNPTLIVDGLIRQFEHESGRGFGKLSSILSKAIDAIDAVRMKKDLEPAVTVLPAKADELDRTESEYADAADTKVHNMSEVARDDFVDRLRNLLEETQSWEKRETKSYVRLFLIDELKKIKTGEKGRLPTMEEIIAKGREGTL
jgi:hypothetical protein